MQGEVESLEDPRLGLAVEVHQCVAARQEVDPRDRGVLDQVVPAEDHRAAKLLVEQIPAAVLLDEVFRQQLGRDVLHLARRVSGVPRPAQRVLVDVGGVDLHPLAERVDPHRLREDYRQGVGLFARGAAGAPDPDRLPRLLPRQDPRDDLAAQRLPGRGVAEERSHVDQDRVEQQPELLGVHLQVVGVAGVRGDPDNMHPLVHSAIQASPLVPREVEASAATEVFQQLLELGVDAVFIHGIGIGRVDRGEAVSGADLLDECGGDLVERQHGVDAPGMDGGAGHPETLRGRPILGDDGPPHPLDEPDAVGAVAPGSTEDDGDGTGPEAEADGLEAGRRRKDGSSGPGRWRSRRSDPRDRRPGDGWGARRRRPPAGAGLRFGPGGRGGRCAG